MDRVSKEIEDAIRGAIQLEIDGQKFFNHAADVTENDNGKKMFMWLADEEVKHLEAFGKLFSKILKGDDWKKYIRGDNGNTEAPLITKLKAGTKEGSGKIELDAIRIGMELEKNAIQFFQDASRKADDPVASRIFNQIAEEEKFHYDILQSQYDSVTNSGFWMGSADFKMDGMW